MVSYGYNLTPDGPWLLSGLGSCCIRHCLANEVVKMKMSPSFRQLMFASDVSCQR